MIIRIATQEDITAVEKLRTTAYQNATGSIISDTSFLHWNESDEQSITLILENEEKQIISTLQGKILTTKAELEKFFDISLNTSFSFPIFPTFTIGKASTFLEYRGLGYTAIMRILFLKACLNSEIQSISSTMQADASRIPLLKQMGYFIEEADVSHRKNSHFNNTSAVLFNLLHKQNFVEAIAVAKDKIITPISAIEIPDELLLTMKRKISYFCVKKNENSTSSIL